MPRGSRTPVPFLFLLFLLFAEPHAGAGDGQHAHEAPRAQRVPPEDLRPDEAFDVALYRRVLPSVVTIRVVTRPIGAPPSGALGSGVVVGADGLVLTAAHVVEGARAIAVTTHEGASYPARVRFSEPEADIALLEVTGGADLPVAELGDSDHLAVGQRLYVVGAPFGLEGSLSVGRVSAFRDFQQLYDGTIRAEFIQTDAAINSGNSGGPAFDSKGRVVGIASRILTRSGGSDGLGFLVTIDTAKALMALDGRVWTGLTGVFLSREELAELFHLDLPGGLLVQDVAPGSPAERAGLRPGTVPGRIGRRDLLLGGDLVIEIGGQETCHAACLAAARSRIEAKDTIEIRFLRGPKMQTAVLDVGGFRWDAKREATRAPGGR